MVKKESKSKKSHPEVKRKRQSVKKQQRRPSERARVERMLGRKFLTGEIPVIPPDLMEKFELKCPIPPKHVVTFDKCCADYSDGKMTKTDVINKVGEILNRIRQPVEPPTYKFVSKAPEKPVEPVLHPPTIPTTSVPEKKPETSQNSEQ